MSGHFDRSETRPWKTREAAMFRDFKAVISITKANAAAVRRQTRGIDIAQIKRCADLARIPVLRQAQLSQMIADEPPYGGRLASRPGLMRHLLIRTAAGHSRDWWNAARAMHAAGFVKGDIILNCASYHMRSDGHMVEGGAAEIECSVIPAGSARIDRHLDAIHQLKPTAYCGRPGGLRRILEAASAANADVSSIKKALVFGAPLSTHFRREAAARGIQIRQAYAHAEAGIIAFETSGPGGGVNEGMIVNEGLILEIVRQGTDIPAAPGEVGEIVVTRLNVDFPLLRFGTGDLSRILPGPSPCGRTNLRILGWMGRAEETAQFHDRTVLPSQVLEMGAKFACIARMRLVLRGDARSGESILRVEGPKNDPSLPADLRASMKAVFGFEAQVDIVNPGTLPKDGKLIADERLRA